MATRGRAWALGLGLLLAGIFLYPGGPSFLDEYHFTRPILSERTELPDGTVVIRPSTDKVAIEERFRRMDMVAWRGLDLEHNQMTFKMHEHLRFPWHIGGWDLWGSKEDRTTVPVPKKIIYGNKRERIKVHLLGPLTVPGGGLGWLAVPIPFLGLIGLVGMVLVMGRRGPLVMLAYTAICVVAICSTLMPFIFAQQVSELIEISPLGLMGTPFPGIENLLTGPVMSDSWLLIFGLVLSAGVPWLLTGMFLRPAKGAGPQRDAGVALE
ncbi:hypothetical protein IIA79_04745 [bacterium]|nr:hypothetical protein [bacterium]